MWSLLRVELRSAATKMLPSPGKQARPYPVHPLLYAGLQENASYMATARLTAANFITRLKPQGAKTGVHMGQLTNQIALGHVTTQERLVLCPTHMRKVNKLIPTTLIHKRR